MKKGLIMLMTVLLMLGCGCTQNNGRTLTKMENSHVEPPRVILLESMEDYQTLVDMIDRSDEELSDFLQQKNYDMNGINSREELLAFKEAFEAIPFPVIPEAAVTGITHYPDREEYTIYLEDPEGVRYVVETSPEIEKAKSEANSVPKRSVDGAEGLYKITLPAQPGQDTDRYLLEIEDTMFLLLVRGAPEKKVANRISAVSGYGAEELS